MLFVTTETIPGKEFDVLGAVMGATIQSKHIGKDLLSGFKNIVGGELTAYTEMMKEARNIATERMLDDAKQKGADAIVGVRYATSAIMDGTAEVMVYGTAVKFQ